MREGSGLRFTEDVDDRQLPNDVNQPVLWDARFFRNFADMHSGRRNWDNFTDTLLDNQAEGHDVVKLHQRNRIGVGTWNIVQERYAEGGLKSWVILQLNA